MHKFHGFHKRKAYFEGWYLKHQKGDCSIAFIPAYHIDKEGNRTASIQVITNKGSYHFPFMEKDFSVSRRHFCVKIGNNLFSENGISVDLENQEIKIAGTIHYSSFTMLRSDIMGPFCFVPFMQCNHGVLSMLHSLKGSLNINGQDYDLRDGVGYVEKDFGSSFPGFYTWTQCSDWTGKQDCSLMVSAADIPFGPFTFTGCICAVWYHGKEYRFATYLGARVVRNTEKELWIRQGRYRLYIRRLSDSGHKPLYAPDSGSMNRIIKENIACRVHYRLTAGKKVIFDFTSHRASYEYVGSS